MPQSPPSPQLGDKLLEDGPRNHSPPNLQHLITLHWIPETPWGKQGEGRCQMPRLWEKLPSQLTIAHKT